MSFQDFRHLGKRIFFPFLFILVLLMISACGSSGSISTKPTPSNNIGAGTNIQAGKEYIQTWTELSLKIPDNVTVRSVFQKKGDHSHVIVVKQAGVTTITGGVLASIDFIAPAVGSYIEYYSIAEKNGHLLGQFLPLDFNSVTQSSYVTGGVHADLKPAVTLPTPIQYLADTSFPDQSKVVLNSRNNEKKWSIRNNGSSPIGGVGYSVEMINLFPDGLQINPIRSRVDTIATNTTGEVHMVFNSPPKTGESYTVYVVACPDGSLLMDVLTLWVTVK